MQNKLISVLGFHFPQHSANQLSVKPVKIFRKIFFMKSMIPTMLMTSAVLIMSRSLSLLNDFKYLKLFNALSSKQKSKFLS